MDENEIVALVEIMVDSGSSLKFSNSERYVADKHSTGGIGDKISLILAPIIASAGVKVPMIAGRGLGFTGGTIDKLESIELDYGVLLNIAPDHIDYHGSFEEYKRVKKRILEAQKSSFENDPFELYKWITGEEAEAIQLADLPFRFQMISKSIINDSKSTNMHSLEYAIE